MDDLIMDFLWDNGFKSRLFVAHPELVLPALITFLLGAGALVFALTRWLCGAGRKNGDKVVPGVHVGEKARPDGDNVLTCRLCTVALLPEHRDLHAQGRRHKKFLAADQQYSRAIFEWADRDTWEAVHPPKASSGYAAAGDDDEDGGRGGMVAAEGAKVKRSGQPTETLSLQGSNVALVAAAPATAEELSSGDWERAVGTKKKGGKGGAGGAGGAGGSGTGTSNKEVLKDFMHMEGSRNILDGLVVVNRFLTPGAENVLMSFVDGAIAAGQAGRLRGATYTPSKDGRGLVLNYGCFFDVATGDIVPSKSVEPFPPQLRDIATRVASDAQWPVISGGSSSTSRVPDTASIVVLEPGQFLPPHIVSNAAFRRPFVAVALGADEDLLLGLRITQVSGAAPGEFAAGFAHRFVRRSLIAFNGTVSTMPQQAIAATMQRFVLIYLRCIEPGLRGEMVARGNMIG
jgi:hypothetical protein